MDTYVEEEQLTKQSNLLHSTKILFNKKGYSTIGRFSLTRTVPLFMGRSIFCSKKGN
jgi:hypothetical protein